MKLNLIMAKLVERGVNQAVFLNNLPKFQGFSFGMVIALCNMLL